ncbi:MAG: hypothetical protein GKS00_21445 [Alphaproteobacteria bacterium]|nr:hypothetical protein [Alphaproteobacteria bacterium]
MPWRMGLVVAMGLFVGGCFLPAYQIVSWTATGVSYVFSGKGVGDHALSLAVNQDCATLRVLQGKHVCVDYEGDFGDSWTAMASTWRVPDADDADSAEFWAGSADDSVEQPTLAFTSNGNEASPNFQLSAFDGVPRRETAKSRPVSVHRGLDFDGLVLADRSSLGNLSAPREKLIEDGSVAGQKSKPLQLVSVRQISEQAVEPAIYLVMGSFRKQKNAARLGAQHSEITTIVSKVVSDGRVMYRLLAGPVERTALKGMQTALAKAGVRNSWALHLCRGSLNIPPCQPVLQQAALP